MLSTSADRGGCVILQTDYRELVEWIVAGRLNVEPLIDQLASPADCRLVYEGTASSKKEMCIGVMFDALFSDEKRCPSAFSQ